MIPIPEAIANQLPVLTKYRLLSHLHQEFDGIPLPPSSEALSEALELVDACLSSPVFDYGDKQQFRDFKEALMEHADDWHRMKADLGDKAVYRVLVQMQEEIQSLRYALNTASRRLDAYDEARLNHARRVIGMPPARSFKSSGVNTPPGGVPRFACPSNIQRLSADRLRDALEEYLDESPPFDVSRDQMVRALKVCCGLEEDTK